MARNHAVPICELISAVAIGLFVIVKPSGAEPKVLCSPVYITVSSLNESPGKLELNWDTNCGHVPDWVGLFEVDPNAIKTATPLEKVSIDLYPWGYYRTNISIGTITLPGGWDKKKAELENTAIPGPHCLPFWIGSYTKDVLQETNCLKIHPTWMNDKKDYLGGIPLSKLLIPGTHNSGSFYSNTSVTRGEGLHRFVLTQDHDIWTQLVFGIRYLDFRIGYYPPLDGVLNSDEEFKKHEIIHDDRFWVNHDLIKITPLVPLLREIKKFVEMAKGEIVVVDIHRLPVGFYLINGDIRKLRHKMLVDLLFRELGDIAIDFKEIMSPQSRSNLHLLSGPRPRDIWATGKKLIISYPEETITKGATWLWPPLRQMWGDKQTPSDLKHYIQNVLSHSHPPTNVQGNPLWAIMAQLTPSPLDILFNPGNNLRKMADVVNKNLTNWIKNDWWKKANIIATDFYLGNNFVELSINSIMFKTTYIKDDY